MSFSFQRLQSRRWRCLRGRQVRTSAAQAMVAIVAVLAAAVSLTNGGVVLAHTKLDTTTPADGATVAAPVTEIRISFTGPTTVAEEGFEILRSDGTKVEPITIDSIEGTSYVLVFNPGLGEGTYGVRWSVLSADSHPLSGTFTFNVTPPPTTVPPTTTTIAGATTAPTSTQTTTASTPAPATTQDPAAVASSAPDGSIVPGSSAPPTTAAAFGELLNERGDGGMAITRIGHLLRFTAALFGLGGLAMMLWVIRSDKHDFSVVLNAVRLSGVVVALGAALEWAAYRELVGSGSGGLFDSGTGQAAVLSMLGGVMMLFGLSERGSLEPIGSEFRWRPGASSAVGLVGALAVLVSFGFDGHGALRGPDSVMRVIDVVHVAVAAVWAGGVVTLATVAWLRRRRGGFARVGHAVVRFSPIATVTLVVAAVTGFAMMFMVAESPTAPTGSPWGRTLIAKLVLVAVAVAAGAFNRFSLLPAVNANPDSADTASRIRVALTVESVVLFAVVIATAFLVTLSAVAG